jgi:hypothetical protein
MAIDPMLYKKYNGRSVDVGSVLVQADAEKSRRDKQPKGVSGGIRFSLTQGRFGEGLFLLRWLSVFGKKSDR